MVSICDLKSVRSEALQGCLRGEISCDRGKAGDLRASLFLSVCGR